MLIILIAAAVAVYMAWSIGANDSANSLGAAVGSRAMSLKQAIIIGSVMGLIGALLLSSPVSKTIGSGIMDPLYLTLSSAAVILLAAAILLTLASILGMPLSTTQTLIGAAIGYSLSQGIGINLPIIGNIVTSWAIAPFIGLALGALLYLAIRSRLSKRIGGMLAREKAERYFVILQFFAVALLALAYGANNIPNAVGLFYSVGAEFNLILVAASIAFAVGILTFGRRVVQTLGRRLVSRELSSTQGFSIQLSSGLTVLFFTLLGMPISTTHVTVGSFLGTSLTGGRSRISWRTLGEIFATWAFTIPVSIALGWVFGMIL